jgi:hypothetical protein
MTDRHRARSRRRRIPVALIATASATVAALSPAAASAATVIGQTGGSNNMCNPDFTWIQDSTGPTTPSYAVPAGGGVITSWSHDRSIGSATAQLRLKLFQKTGPNSYLTLAHSDFETLNSPGVNVFATRIPVEGGELLGMRTAGPPTVDIDCLRDTGPGDLARNSDTGEPDPPIGSTVSFTFNDVEEALNLAATLEPDCDGDGLGDETQDPALPLGEACGKGNRALTLDANKNKVKKRKKVTLSGRLTPLARQGPCESGQMVELQRKRPSQASFTTFAAVQTDAQGSFSLKRKVKKTFEYRAQVVETAACGAALSNTEKVKVKKKK